jgi:hypothetical protein
MTTGSATSADGTMIGDAGPEPARRRRVRAGAAARRRQPVHRLARPVRPRPGFIRPAFDALSETLPRSRRAVFAGLDHGGSSDRGPSNRGGQPAVVAPEIRSFFAQR